MMCPSSPEFLAVYLPEFGVDIHALSERGLSVRHEHMTHLRSIREFAAAERWGWLTLTGSVLQVSGITQLDLNYAGLPLQVLEPLEPVHTVEMTVPDVDGIVDVTVDPAGEALFVTACAAGTTVMVSGRPVATTAVHDDIRNFLSGMVPR